MSKSSEPLFTLPSNPSIVIKSAGSSQTTSDAGALLMRQVIDRTGIVKFLADRSYDPRDPNRIKYSLTQLLMQWLLHLIQGWGGLWAEQVRTDPSLGAASSPRRGDGVIDSDGSLASQSTLSRLLGLLARKENLAVLGAAVLRLAVEHMRVRNGGERREEVVIDVDAMPLDAHGKQSGSKYNGYYRRTVFLPLFASCGETGDVLGTELRPGTQREVTDCEDFILSIAEGVRNCVADRVIVRMDAGFNGNDVYTRLEAAAVYYVMRLRKNAVLDEMAAPYLRDRSSEQTEYIELSYQAASWGRARRVILVVKPRPGELFNDYHFLVTNLGEDLYAGEDLAVLYSQRGKAEMHQGEIKAACALSLPSSPRPKSHYRQAPIVREEAPEAEESAQAPKIRAENEAYLLIQLLAYQLLHIARSLYHSPPPPVASESDADLPPQRTAELREAVPSGTPLDESPDPVSETAVDSSPHAQDNTAPISEEAPHLHIHSFRLQLLKVGASLARHGRYVTFYIAASAVQAWQRFWKHFQQLRWHTVPDF